MFYFNGSSELFNLFIANVINRTIYLQDPWLILSFFILQKEDFYKSVCFLLCNKMPKFLFTLLIFFNKLSVNHNRKPYWVGIIKRGPVIWASSTGLYVLTIKSLVSTQKDYLDRKGLYLKSVTLLAILMLEKKKMFRQNFFVSYIDCLLEMFLISYKVSSQCHRDLKDLSDLWYLVIPIV